MSQITSAAYVVSDAFLLTITLDFFLRYSTSDSFPLTENALKLPNQPTKNNCLTYLAAFPSAVFYIYLAA